jgi:hypothetical protein
MSMEGPKLAPGRRHRHHLRHQPSPGPVLPLSDTEDAAERERLFDYLRFLFAHHHDVRGRYLLLESLDQVRWRYQITDYDRRRVADRLLPLTLELYAHNGYADVRASLLRNDDLLSGHLAVSPAGKVSLQGLETVLTGLPVVDDALNDLPAHSTLFSLEAGWEALPAEESG